MYYCLYVFSNADTKASFLCLSGYTIIDKASFAANGNNIAFFWLISIGGDQFAVYKHKTAFNKRNHAAFWTSRKQPDDEHPALQKRRYHLSFSNSRFRNLFCLLYSGNQNGSMFYPNKIFNKKVRHFMKAEKPGFFILDEDITNYYCGQLQDSGALQDNLYVQAPQKNEEPWALFSGSQ